jgi:2-dehydropantoate 2-reductase
MNVHVVGAGAIGGLVGAFLARAGHQVTLVDANARHVAAIRAGGLRVTGVAEFTARVPALEPDELREPLDVVLLAVKSRHTADALRVIAPLLREDGCVVSLQNGLEEYAIADAVGARRTVGALVTFGGFYEEPGRIRYGGAGTLTLGELDGTVRPRTTDLADLLRAAHEVEVTDNIFGFLWSKTAVAAPYFATAVADRDVPELFATAAHRPVFGALVAEVVRVGRAEGVRFEEVDGFDPAVFADRPEDAAALDACWQAQIAYWQAHSQTRTGVWRDLAIHHRPTEVDHILLPVVRRAAAAGVPVPGLTALVAAVHEAETGQRALGVQVLAELDRITAP